jgi:hypothetical protein
MRKLFYFLILQFTCLIGNGQEKLLSPPEFLGYEPGQQFTRHHSVVEYFRHVAETKPNVKLHQYGETYEGRPLIYAVISSIENINRIDEIQNNNLKRSGMLPGVATDKTAIVWLSYNVHGDEASSTEASMLTLYELANGFSAKITEWLKNTVVIIDPCLNPDGRDRYVNFYNQNRNLPFNANGDAQEHHDLWPGGRANHYLFDLNRDWAWGTQAETIARLKIYESWLPHVHVDFHEQGHNSPYYFAPAAEPFHEVISPWQREFQTMIGRNNAKYFDEQGWLYFTKEVFDLYYPSYGDTYPTYSGAIGMTYEQAGGGYAGLGIRTETGDNLTLKDRIIHHHTTGLSTIEITSKNAAKVVDEFQKYFNENISSPASPYKTYVIKADNNVDKLAQIIRWFDSHGIRYGQASASKTTRGFDYQTQTTGNVTVTTDDILVSTYQPKSRFITAVFEPVSKLPDSLTYDITAWNLMYAYDLKAFAINERLTISKPYQRNAAATASVPASAYAYIFKYNHVRDVEFLAALIKKDIRVRASAKNFTIGGSSFDPGALIITRRNNEHIPGFDSVILSTAARFDRQPFTTTTGFVDKGKDLGSGELRLIRAPRVAVLSGPQTSSLSVGEIWHFFEQQIHYPITMIGTEYFKTVDLKKYDVLILPEGYYSLFDDAMLDQVSAWVSAGGKLILISTAINSFADRKIFDIKKYASDDERSEAEKKNKDLKEKEGFPRYEDASRKQVSETISGAIYKIPIDNSHPLGFGLGNFYYTLKTNDLRFAYLDHGWNVGIMKGKAKAVQGFAGFKINSALENSLIFGVEHQGQGQTVYLVDNPLFRSFWENGKLLFANAVFMVGQ